MLTCDECERSFKNRRALAVHKLWHKPGYREKFSAIQKIAQNRPEVRAKRFKSVKAAYADPEKKARHRNACAKAQRRPEVRKASSQRTKEFFAKNPDALRAFLKTSKSAGGKLSKMHRDKREAIGMDSLGFIAEQCVGSRQVDELCEKQKLIVEFYGDYVHADPRRFKPDDRIRGFGYTAKERWDLDSKRIKELESMGYRVIAVWSYESDDHARIRILKALEG